MQKLVFAQGIHNRTNYIEGVNLQISIHTTSDWTQVEFVNLAVCLINEEIIRDVPGLQVSGFNIKKQPYDSTEVRVNYDILMLDLPVEEPLIFYIKKGDIGKTEVTFLSQNHVIRKFENNLNIKGSGANKKAFLIPKDSFGSWCVIKQRITHPECPKLVLAFYYPWYGNPEGPHKRWFHWEPDNHYASVHTPILGYYDSADTVIIKKHIEFAKYAGIDGFIVSWWGRATPSDTVTAKIFEMAEKMKFKVTIYHEHANKVEDVISDVEYLLRKYRRFSSFLKIQEKPVIFYYGRVVSKFSAEEWKEIFSQLEENKLYSCNIAESLDLGILSVFDGLHIYNNIGARSLMLLNKKLMGTVHIHGKIFGATVVPGYNDILVNSPGTVVDRNEGKYYHQAWEAALNSNPDITLITSFNEWHEGTEIEPTKEYGMRYLDITKKYAYKFKNQ